MAPQPIDLAAGAARAAERRLDGDATGALRPCAGLPPHPAGEAWRLDDLVAAAWAWRGEVAAARLALAATRQSETVAGRRSWPAVAATPEYATNADSGTRPWTLALGLSWPLETGGKRQGRVDRSAAEASLALAHLAESLWQVRREVKAAWVDLELARRQSAQAAAVLAAEQATAAWVATLWREGSASQPESLSAAAAVSRAEARVAAARFEEEAARGRLAGALTLSRARLDEVRLARPDLEELPASAAWSAGELAGEAISNRLDLHRAVARYALAEADLRVAVARQYPDLTLGPGLTYDQGQHKLVFGVGFNLPDPAAQQSAIALALGARRQAGLEVERIQAQAMAATSAALASYTAADESLRRSAAARRAGESEVAAAERRLALGAGDRGELLLARRASLDADDAMLAERRRLTEALGALEEAVARPLWPPATLDDAAAALRLGSASCDPS